MIKYFLYNEDGQTLVEYGLLLALIALAAITAVTLFGSKVKSGLFDKASAQLPN